MVRNVLLGEQIFLSFFAADFFHANFLFGKFLFLFLGEKQPYRFYPLLFLLDCIFFQEFYLP